MLNTASAIQEDDCNSSALDYNNHRKLFKVHIIPVIYKYLSVTPSTHALPPSASALTTHPDNDELPDGVLYPFDSQRSPQDEENNEFSSSSNSSDSDHRSQSLFRLDDYDYDEHYRLPPPMDLYHSPEPEDMFAADDNNNDPQVYYDDHAADDVVEQPANNNSRYTPRSQGCPVHTDSLQSGNALKQLRILMRNDEVVWRTDYQRDTFVALINLEEDVIVAIQTNGGKTMAVVLAAQLTKGIMVVVIPYVALKNDWKRRLDKMGIKDI